MNNALPEPTVYLVATDGSPEADHVLDVASTLGASLGGTAEMHILHVLPDLATGGVLGSGAPVDLRPAGMLILDRATSLATARFHGKVIGHLDAGKPWRTIVQMASSLAADLIVVGTAGRTGLARFALGSVAEQVVRHAGCPVLVARPKDYQLSADERIEPPCPQCVAVRVQTNRASMWCERHGEHHPHGLLHYELPPSFGVGSMNFRP